MTPELDVYARARSAVLEAQQTLTDAFQSHGITPCAPPTTGDGEKVPEPGDVVDARQALTAAHETLTEAQAPLAEEIEAAWEANRQAVVAADAEVQAAVREWVSVAVRVGQAARDRRERPEHLPVLTDEEHVAARDAYEQVTAARQALDAALAAFKAGITADQLAEVG